MQTVQLQIEDSKLETFLTLIDNLKDGIVQKLTVNPTDEFEEYTKTQQFQDDKNYFQTVLKDLESGKVKTISHKDVWEQIDKHTKAS